MISPKWIPVAEGWTGNKEGRHCHWCKHKTNSEDGGEAYCGNSGSQFSNGKRIRSWDGEGCAAQCKLFEIDEWYTEDENFYKTFAH